MISLFDYIQKVAIQKNINFYHKKWIYIYIYKNIFKQKIPYVYIYIYKYNLNNIRKPCICNHVFLSYETGYVSSLSFIVNSNYLK